MPKTPSVILKKLLEDRQIELLDIYHYRDKDIIRVKDKLSGKVDLYVSKTHVRDMADKAELEKLASEIEAKLRG
jgi:hypothetical protein